jgi:hypothetical protein
LRPRSAKNQLGLFYAGHGIAINGTNYLLPSMPTSNWKWTPWVTQAGQLLFPHGWRPAGGASAADAVLAGPGQMHVPPPDTRWETRRSSSHR